MKLARFVLVAMLVLAFAILGGSKVGDSSSVLAHGQPDCTVTVQPGESIQRAIDAAAPGAVICLEAGTYEENLTIKKSLTLRGTGAKPEDVRIVGVKEGYPVISIESEQEIEVHLENLTAAEAKGWGCAVEDPRWICPNGVQALGNAKALIRNVQVSGNMWYGLEVRDSATVTLTNSTVSGNRRDGLWVLYSATVTLANSKVSGNGWTGLDVRDLAEVTLTNSQVSGNKDNGLEVWGSAEVTLTNSQVSGNGWTGLVVEGSAKVEVRSSTIEGNGTDPWCQKLDEICNGITVRGKSQTRIMDSKIINNTDWGVAAWLKKCGYKRDDFTGKVTIDSLTRMWLAESEDEQTTKRTEITGNNKAGNHEGEVCLP